MKYVGDVIRMKEVDLLLPYTLNKNSLLLDIGAGNGQYQDVCIRHGFIYAGIDKQFGFPVRNVWKQDVFKAKDLDMKYTCILLVDVLEHIEKDLNLLKKLHDLLVPGGYLLIHVPNKQRSHIFCSPKDNSDHVRIGYSKIELDLLLEQSGFNVISYKPTYELYDAMLWDLFYCLDHNINIDTKTIRAKCTEKQNFIPYGLINLSQKK